MKIVINLGLHWGRIGDIFIMGIFTLSRGGGEFLTFKTGIPGGFDQNQQPWLTMNLTLNIQYALCYITHFFFRSPPQKFE